jgi:hypothetical protein
MLRSIMALLQGYKTYIVGTTAILYALASAYFGYLDPKSAIDIIFAALGLMGVRSGITTALIQILQVMGLPLPANPTQAAVKNAVAMAAPIAQRLVPLLFIAVMGISILSMTACTTAQGQDPKTILTGIQFGTALAEGAFESICPLSGGGPTFCADNMANYLKGKKALDAAITTAAAAINLSGNINTANVAQLLATLEEDWKTFNGLVNTVKARDAAVRGVSYRPIPLN